MVPMRILPSETQSLGRKEFLEIMNGCDRTFSFKNHKRNTATGSNTDPQVTVAVCPVLFLVATLKGGVCLGPGAPCLSLFARGLLAHIAVAFGGVDGCLCTTLGWNFLRVRERQAAAHRLQLTLRPLGLSRSLNWPAYALIAEQLPSPDRHRRPGLGGALLPARGLYLCLGCWQRAQVSGLQQYMLALAAASIS